MRRAARVDANQPIIAAGLRGEGYPVQLLHTIGGGCPDLVVAAPCACGRPSAHLLEVKDPLKPKRDQMLTPQQVKWHGDWMRNGMGRVVVVKSLRDALIEIGAIRAEETA